MEGVVAGFLASAGQPADYMPGAEHWPIIRTIVLVLFIPITLIAILLLYGGNVQNTNIVPIALRSRGTVGAETLQAPRRFVTSALDGKRMRCTFYLKFVDRRNRPRLIRLAPNYKFHFTLSALSRR